jgi:type I restriction enzyme R subunit
MQTIARANRVYPGKQSGLIVDYANVFASLEKALAIYGKGRGGETPVRDKKELAEQLRKAVRDATQFCTSRGVNLAKIEEIPTANFARVGAIQDAAKLLSPETVRRDFLSNRLVVALYRAVARSGGHRVRSRCRCLAAIAEEIRTDRPAGYLTRPGYEELLDSPLQPCRFDRR